MQELRERLAQDLAKECKSLEDIHTLLRDLFRQTIEEVLEAEMTEHLGYEKHDSDGINTGNSRNGYSKKTVQTQLGKTTVEVPRDRKGRFEPKIIKKYETNASEVEEQIIAMYAKGMSTRDIEAHMRDIYGIDCSPELVSRVTDKIMPMIIEWQSRPLDRLYPIVYLDAIHFKVRKDGKIVTKAVYTALGIDSNGMKDILGFWVGENESASFWVNVCNELKSRGVEDILIVCKDGLSGFSDAIHSAFPNADTQLCVIHQIRSCLRYVNYKDSRMIVSDMKPIYQAATLEQAEVEFERFKQKWQGKYPLVISSWERNWLELTVFFSFPHAIRRVIYTTNSVEAYHRQLRKVTKTKTAFPTDDSLRKIVYLATADITKKWTMPVQNWAECISQLIILFGDRVTSKIVV